MNDNAILASTCAQRN